MKMLHVLLAVALVAPLLPAFGQHAGHQTAAPAAGKAEMSDGEVRRVDKARGTILLKHGEIRNLGMGAMTMGFKLKDAKLADGLAVGDKVKFAAEQKGDDLIVTQIIKAP